MKVFENNNIQFEFKDTIGDIERKEIKMLVCIWMEECVIGQKEELLAVPV